MSSTSLGKAPRRIKRTGSYPNFKPGARKRCRRRAQRFAKDYADMQALLYGAIKDGEMPPAMRDYVDDPSAYE